MSENGILVLKGRNIIAQGKRRRSVALGRMEKEKIVCEITVFKEKFLFQTKGKVSCFLRIMFYNSVRRELSALFIEFTRTVFLLHSLPRAAFWFVPPSTLPWARLFWPFRPGRNTSQNLCIKSSYM